MTDPSGRQGKAATSLSVTFDPGKWGFLGFLSCAILCLGFAALFAYRLSQSDYGPYVGSSGDIMPLVGFSLGALCFAGWTIREYLDRRQKIRVYRLQGNEILCFDAAGLLWREATQAYQQVGWHEEQRCYPNKYGRQFYTAQVITLDHLQPDRGFEIFAHQDSSLLQEHCARWSEALGLPVVRAETDQHPERTTEEITKPLVDIASVDRLTADFEFDAPPAGVTWGRDDGVLWVKARLTRVFANYLVPLFVVLGLASAIAAGLFVEELAQVPYIFMDLAINLILLTYLFRYVVRVTSSEAIGRFRFCGFTLWRTRLPLETIVRIRRIHGRFSDGILMEGRKKLIYLVFLDREVATWLMAFFQSAIINEETGE